MNKYRFLILLFLLVSSGAESISPVRQFLGEIFSDGELTEAKQDQFNKELIEASVKGDIKKIEELIDKGADIEATDRWGQTALFMAPSPEVVNALLDKGADIEAQDKIGRTPLINFAGRGDIDIVNALIDKRADIHVKTHYNETAVYVASHKGHHEVVSILSKAEEESISLVRQFLGKIFSNGELTEAKQTQLNHELIEASVKGDIKKIEELIDKGADVEARRDYRGQTALFMAPSPEVVNVLVDKGADIEATDSWGQTALFMASSPEVVNALLDKGAEIDAQDKDGRTPLINFAGSGDIDIVKALIDKRADIHVKTHYNETAVYIASQNGHHEVVSILSKKGANVNVKNGAGNTALIVAVENNHIKVVEVLSDNGADVHAQNNMHLMALHLAYSRLEIIKVLKEATVKVQNMFGRTDLIEAASQGQLDIMNDLIEQGADINAQDNEGRTALWWAVYEKQLEAVNTLLANGADVSIKDNNDTKPLNIAGRHNEIKKALMEVISDQWALIEAASQGQLNTVKALIEKGVDIDAKSKYDEKTALIAAIDAIGNYRDIDKELFEVVNFLIEKGADIDATDRWGKLVLMYALSSPEAVNILIENGANVNAKTIAGKTVLMYALESRTTPLEVVDILLDNGADVHATINYDGPIDNEADVYLADKDGLTVLMYALSPEAVNTLVEKGANVDATDKDGKTALMKAALKMAYDGSWIKVVHALIENGADMQITDKDGKTVLMLAKDHGHFEVVKILEEAQKKSACRRKF